MHSHFTALFLYVGFLYLTGFAFLMFFYQSLLRKHNLFFIIGLSWGLGNFLTGVFLYVLAIINKFNLINLDNLVKPLLLLAGLTLFWGYRSRKKFFSVKINKTNLMALGLLIWFFAPWLYSSFFSYLIDWDAVAIWMFKAKAFFFSPGLWDNVFFQEQALFQYAHRAYPIGLPLLIGAYYRLANAVNDQIAQFYLALFYFNLVMLFYGFLRNHLKTINAWLILLITVSILIFPYLVIYSHNGYADVPFSFVVTLGFVLFIFLHHETEEKIKTLYAGLILLVSGLGLLIKNEGLPFFLIINLFALIRIVQPRQKLLSLKRVLISVLVLTLVLFPVIFWPYFKRLTHLEADSYLFNAAISPDFIPRLKFIFNLYLNQIIDTSRYGILLIPLLLIFVVEVTFLLVGKQWRSLMPSLMIIFQLAVYTMIYAVTTVPLDWQVLTSFDRLLLHVLPAFFLVIVYQAPATLAQMKGVISSKTSG